MKNNIRTLFERNEAKKLTRKTFIERFLWLPDNTPFSQNKYSFK